MSARKFLSRNVVIVIMIPFIAGSHYGWMKLQEVDNLVSETERKGVPIYSAIRNIRNWAIPFSPRIFSEDKKTQATTDNRNWFKRGKD